METVTRVLGATHEISLKGKNRGWFEQKLVSNVRRALSDFPIARIERPASRVLVTFSEPAPWVEVARRVATVAGLRVFLPVLPAGRTLNELFEHLEPAVDALPPGSFAVRCFRSDKRLPMSSMEVERQVGQWIVDRTGRSVDLDNPDGVLRVFVDRGGLWLASEEIAGAGGLPVGSGGRGLCLLSGGIDSPVAAYSMIRRGMRVDFVHFHSVPRTDPTSVEKVRELVTVLNRYQPPARLANVPLLPIQDQVVARCPEEYRMLLYRRFMVRIAERIAYRNHLRALITGECLGQVASQTVENLWALNSVAHLPLLRPLIAMDKEQIIATARRIGSYEVSIIRQTDSCTYLMPDHPALAATPEELREAEAELDIDELVRQALHNTAYERVQDMVAWEEIPSPVTRSPARRERSLAS
jgi:thiamine biosynthesis protein ThiI